MIRILLIHTGGTIGMSQSAHGLAPCENLVENFARDYAARCPDLELHVESFSPLIDSANITVDHWNSLICRIRACARDFDRIVITHGTDTIAYTAAVLSFALCDITVPVILTGGMLPLGVAGNDSAENLQAALSPERDFLPAIWVEFDAQRFPGAAVTKFHSADNNAFLATHKISNAMTAIPESTLQLLRPANIVIITITPGMSADWLAPALQDADAAILRVFGAGTIGSDAAISPMIIRMRAAEKPLVLVSQCIFGGLKLEYAASQPLRQSGLVNGGRMTVEAAYAKILYALSMDLSYSERCALLAQPLCGEMDEID